MTAMDMERALIQKWRVLPPDKQREMLDSAEFLAQQARANRPRRSLEGLWANLDFEITDHDIAQAREEMWGNFPRDIEP